MRICAVCKKEITNPRTANQVTHPGACRDTYYYKYDKKIHYHLKTHKLPARTIVVEPTEEEYRLMRKRPPKKGMVECLGPLCRHSEKKFMSHDISRNRICPKCLTFIRETDLAAGIC